MCLAPAPARAGFASGYGFSGTNGVFTVACSGAANGGLPTADNGFIDNRGFFQSSTSTCTADPLTGSAMSSFQSGNVMADASATASLGTLKGLATMSSDLQSAVTFPAGFADAGWIDTLTIVDPAHTNQIATMSFVLNVTGGLTANGPNVVALLQLVVGSMYSPTGQMLFNPFYQIQAGVDPSPLAINDTLVFDLPFVVGTPGQFMVRALARAMTSSATSSGNNSASVDFQNSVTWGGIQDITVGGQSIMAQATVSSASSVDWTQPVTDVTEPAVLAILAFGLAGLAFARRRAT